MRNMPILKAHLQEEWNNEACRAKAAIARKRKREDSHLCQFPSAQSQADEEESPVKKPCKLPDESSATL